MKKSPIGILLLNLGTPDAPTPSAIRRYLAEFLWDKRVIEVPRLLWWCILRVILLIRPRIVAKAYQRVWTNDGSPLLAISRQQQHALQKKLGSDYQVALGMRYGNPPIALAVDELIQAGCEQLIVLPLYPQYSATTTASSFDGLAAALKTQRRVPAVRFIRDYHVHPQYINALANSVREHWAVQGRGDLLLLSFHGIPQSYVDKGDLYAAHCQATTAALIAELGLSENEWRQTFQSRVGRDPWLQPYTDKIMEKLPSEGVKTVDVICPGFSADCLETLDEITVENGEIFVEAGGEAVRYIPALNARPDHIALLASIVQASAK